MEVRVRERWMETNDIVVFVLEAPSGSHLPSFAAGAHIDLKLADNLTRQYSLCNRPDVAPDHYRIAVKREPSSRGGSLHAHDRLHPGDRVVIDGPRNAFPLAADGVHHALFGAGIGVTPIIGMAHELSAKGTPFSLDVFARSQADLAFAVEIADFSPAGSVKIHLGLTPEAVALQLATSLAAQPAGGHFYTCGPLAFMEAVRQAGGHWTEGSFHQEHFGAPPIVAAEADGSFEVDLAVSGGTFTIPADRSILDVLVEAGVDVPYSCLSGTCGSCLTGVLEGAPVHRDLYLSEAEQATNDCMLPCVSRSLSARLVLDL